MEYSNQYTNGSLKSKTNIAKTSVSPTAFASTASQVNSTTDNNETLIFYPNPTTYLLNYVASGSGQIEVAIFDFIGNLVYSKKEYNKDGFNQELSL